MEISIYAIRFEGLIVYVGQTKDSPRKRFLKHLSSARTGRKNCPKLYDHIRSHNPSQYDFMQIDSCSHEESEEREKKWIKTHNTYHNGEGLNCHPGGNQTRGKDHYLYGKKPAQHIMEASAAARKGKPLSEQHKANQRAGHAANRLNSKRLKPVKCDQTGEIWDSLSTCAKHFEVEVGSITHRIKYADIKYSRNDGKLGFFTFSYTDKETVRQKRQPSKKVVKIECIETGKIYKSCLDACRELNLQPSNLSNHLAGKRKSAGGYTFKRY